MWSDRFWLRSATVYVELVFSLALLHAPLTEHLAEVSQHPMREGLSPPGSGGDRALGEQTGLPLGPLSVTMFRLRVRVSDAVLHVSATRCLFQRLHP